MTARFPQFPALVGSAKTMQTPWLGLFGDQDGSIPMTDIELIKEKRPDVEVYVYTGAGHGFACDERGSYNEAATKEALGRTLGWLTKYVG